LKALRKTGKLKQAVRIEKRQAKTNKKIVRAFQNEFSFCPTYFFFSNHSKKVRNKEFDSFIFLDENLLPDTTIKLDPNTPFLLAEFGKIEQDTIKYFDSYYYLPGKNGMERRTKFHGGPKIELAALIIKSEQFVQLRKPFHYCVRVSPIIPIRRSPKKVVKRMNNRLRRFHKRKSKKRHQQSGNQTELK